MNLRTFRAASMAEALQQVKGEMGHDAVILHTRTFYARRWLGLKRREVVEITAGRGFDDVAEKAPVGLRPPRIPQTPPRSLAASGRSVSVPLHRRAASIPPPARSAASNTLPTARRPIRSEDTPSGRLSDEYDTHPGGPVTGQQPGRNAAAIAPADGRVESDHCINSRPHSQSALLGTRPLLETPAAASVAIITVSHEVAQLKDAVGELVRHARKSRCPQLPEALLAHYTQLISNEVADEIAQSVLKAVQDEARPEQLSNPVYVRQRIAEQIERLVPSSGRIRRTRTGRAHVVALVGPTGVGKTTTLAKLAANLKLREKQRVGLITLDTFRIAAVDQLRRYADIIGAPLKVVATAEELRLAVEQLSDFDYILVDTAGRSPNDTLRISELKGLLAAAQADEVHLVLSATASQTCVQLAVTRFGEVGVDRVIFTKIDEAAHVGVVLNVVHCLNTKLSYLTTGQGVPDDIEVGRGSRLAQLILAPDVDTPAEGAST